MIREWMSMLLDHSTRFAVTTVVELDRPASSSSWSSSVQQIQYLLFQRLRLEPAFPVTDCHESRANTTAHLNKKKQNRTVYI